ncbi:MAG: hypothetical protein U0L25_00075 [Ligilactobacillus ruminis]|nr:hypothetical protein [Ligilactobacillus ruminis]
MLMDNTLELLGITDSNIKITRFSAESVNGEKRNVIEARLTYNACGYGQNVENWNLPVKFPNTLHVHPALAEFSKK